MISLSEVYDMPKVVRRKEIKIKVDYPVVDQNIFQLFLYGIILALLLCISITNIYSGSTIIGFINFGLFVLYVSMCKMFVNLIDNFPISSIIGGFIIFFFNIIVIYGILNR